MTHDDPRGLLQQLLQRIAPEIDLEAVDEHAPLREALERDYPEVDTVAGFIAYIAAR